MTLTADFVVLGKPVPKARPRVDRRSGRIYTPTKSAKYEKRVQAEAFAAARWMKVGDARLRTIARRDPPWPERMDCARERPTQRSGKSRRCECSWCASSVEVELRIFLPDKRTRDLDNIEKSLLDGMAGVLFRDDRQVRSVFKSGELDRANPRVEVVVRLIPPAQLDLTTTLEAVQCPSCEGVGSFHVDLPSGTCRQVVCGECGGTGASKP